MDRMMWMANSYAAVKKDSAWTSSPDGGNSRNI